MSRIQLGIASTLIVAAVAACAPRPGEVPLPPGAGTDNTGQTTLTDVGPIVKAATRDAASRLNIDPRAIEVVSALRVTWSDGSLGCPAPEMQYTQALVPGYRVRLKAGGQEFDYHAAANGHLVLCPPERAIEPSPGDPI
jgi:hypothetical protein